MSYCPECGGELKYFPAGKQYACKSCGLTLTYQELIELRDRLTPNEESDEDARKRRHKEYLKWWLSKK